MNCTLQHVWKPRNPNVTANTKSPHNYDVGEGQAELHLIIALPHSIGHLVKSSRVWLMLRVHAQQASNGFWGYKSRRSIIFRAMNGNMPTLLSFISSLTMKITHKIAHRMAAGHASTNKRMSHSNAKIGFDAIVSVVPSSMMWPMTRCLHLFLSPSRKFVLF